MAFLDVEGDIYFPFLPDGAGIPLGQGARGTRDLTAVFAGVRVGASRFRVLPRANRSTLGSLLSGL